MADKAEWKRRAREQERIADDLFSQLQLRAAELQRVDDLLVNAELPGPTIEAWVMQVRNLLSSLVTERGIVSGGIAEAFTLQRVAPRSGPVTHEPDDGEYTFLTDADLSMGRLG